MTVALETPPLRRILVGLDHPERGEGPVQQEAARLAKALGATLILSHVAPELAAPALAPVVGRAALEGLGAVERSLEVAGARCEPPHLVSTQDPVPHRALQAWSRERRADLLLLGGRARSGASRLLFGATAEEAVRIAACPVWFAPPVAAAGPIRRVLCAVDGSAAADAALALAGRLARQLGASLSAVCVLPRLDGPLALTLRPPIPRARATSRGFRAALARVDLGGLPVQVVCRRGQPAEAILRAASELRADVLVLGCAGRTGLRRLGRPNTAERVLRRAPCALLIVPTTARAPGPGAIGRP